MKTCEEPAGRATLDTATTTTELSPELLVLVGSLKQEVSQSVT